MPMKNPPNPGDFIKTEIVEAAAFVGDSGCGGAWGFAAGAVELAEWQGGAVGRYGAADREGVRSQDGYADAHAVGLRDCEDAEAGEADSGGAGYAGGLRCGNGSDKRARRT